MKGYVFISNSTKPNEEKANSREKPIPTNVSRPCLKAALEMGYEVFWGINRNKPEELMCDFQVKLFDSHTYRSLTAFSDNRIAVHNLNRVLSENNIEVIHCNTPVGGLVGRLCGKKHHVKKIIYTAHGFHFFKGAPLINRTIYKWAEQIMAHWTDAIITMNQEDYEAALKFRLRRDGKVFKVHGVGITLAEYENIIINREQKRSELGIKGDDVVCVSAGDLIERKNYRVAIEAIAKVNNPKLKYIICGVGPEKDRLVDRVNELGIENQVLFLGFRNDIKEILKAADIFLFTSLQEGLPRSLMEAMAVGLPVVASRIRGNVDLIVDGEGGLLRDPTDIDGFAEAINSLMYNNKTRLEMTKKNKIVIKEYDTSVVEKEIADIYKQVLTYPNV